MQILVLLAAIVGAFLGSTLGILTLIYIAARGINLRKDSKVEQPKSE